jgi:porin
LAWAGAAAAEDAPAPPVAVDFKESLDLWRNTRGGLTVGDTQLSKLQLGLTFNGEAMGHPGWSGRLFYFRTNGERLSGSRVGDIQTVSNIEALSADRLMVAWIERRFGETASLRAGLIDLNADFDSIDPAGLFLDSSHGIGPDLSKTGLNGPSIFPVSSLGLEGAWSPSQTLTLHAAVFDGVPGDPQHPKAFAAVKLSRADGALLISQADWSFAKDAQASFGAWRYTAAFDPPGEPGRRQHGWAGAYAFVQGPLGGAGRWQGWARAGIADPKVSLVANYLGAGVVRAGPLPGRPDDRLGFAVAHAGLAGPIRRRDGLPAAETTLEVTYLAPVTAHVAVQPDVQYVVHPASQPGLKDALVIGLRLSLSFTTGDGR